MKSPWRVNHFDLLNFGVSSLRDGLTPLFALYLVNNLGLKPTQIGWVMGAASASTLVAQVPLGYLYDRLNRKGLPIVGASLVMLLGSLALLSRETPSFALVMGVQILFGAATAALVLGVPALSVATTSDEELGARLARNEVFGKAGNFTALGLAGALTSVYSLRSIFFIWSALAVLTAALALFTKPGRKARARTKVTRSALTSSPTFMWLVLICFAMFLANTGALTIFEQVFAPTQPNGGASWIAFVSALAQGATTLTIMGLAKLQKCRALVIVLATTFVVVLLRLGTFSLGPFVLALIVGQIFDGIVGGVLSAVPARLLAERHRSEFNVLAGALGAVGALGSLLSVSLSGPLVEHFKHAMSLWVYGIPAALGLMITLASFRTLSGHKPGK